MNKLENARDKINKIDEQMSKLFCERMQAAEEIAEYKKENGLPVFDAVREQQVIDNNTTNLKDDTYKSYYRSFIKSVMDISKSYQKSIVADKNTITMNLADKSYNIIVKRGALKNADKYLNLSRKVLIVTDDGVPENYSTEIAKLCEYSVTAVLPQGEDTKSFDSLNELCSIMLEHSFTRNDCVVAVGGGVIGDLSGFAASSYMRGIDFYNIPTTLLSQVDSSIGGKVAVNLDGIKNIVGAFYQPKCVLIDADVLNTLPERQFSNGLAEAIKMSLTCDKDLFELIENGDIKENIEQIIMGSLLIKKNIVELDEKEGSIRKVLNFGHTIGHAIEAENFGKLYHGECVALGMLPMCSENVRVRLKKLLNKVNLPTEINFDTNEILKDLKHDKKASSAGITSVFCDEIGTYRFENLQPEDLIKVLL